MNCLLLLIILFCCNGNDNCGTRQCRRENSCNRNRNARTECNVGRDCDCAPVVHSCPSTSPRPQYPYMDVEPRTCGCEEK